MKRRLTSILLFSALLVGGASTLVSCKDHDCDQSLYDADTRLTAELSSQATTITNLANQLAAETSSRETQDEILRGLINNNATAIANAARDANDALTKANANATTISEIQTKLLQLESQLAAYADLATRLGTAEEDIAKLQEQIAGLTGDYDITEMNKKLAELEAKQKTDSARITAIEEGKTTLEEQLQKINATLTGGEGQLSYDQVKAQVEANKSKIAALESKVNDINNKFADYVKEAYTDELNAAIKKASDSLKEDIDDLKEELTEQLNKLFNAMVNMITGIELQATESPIGGKECLSFLGIEAHILGTYYGTAASNCTIGTETIYKDDLMIDEADDNAGIVYVTINPSNMNFEGTTLKVVDSQGNEAPFTATVTKSDQVLRYGISRANSTNLYAVKIKLDKSKLDQAKTWTSSDAAALKDVAKNILNKLRKPSTTRLDLGEVVSTIAGNFNNRLTAYALQAEQKVTDGKNTETRTITSKLSLAATAFKPLSYNFLKDNETLNNLDLPSFPTLQSKINFNDYKFNWTPIAGMEDMKTSVTLQDMPDLSSITIGGTVPAPSVDASVLITGQDQVTGTVKDDNTVTFDLSKLGATATVKIGGIDVSGLTVDYKKTSQTFDVTIPMDEFNKMIEQINSQVGNMINTVNDIVDQVSGYAETIDGKYITKINDFIQKFENLLRNSNSLLQPAVFYTTSEGSWGQLARESEGATYLKLDGGKASTIFIASSYTDEIIAPAYKKCITVTKKPDGATVSGTNLGQVVRGSVSKIGFEADKEGIYELTYNAVDYSGVKVTKTFYVKVVK